MNKILVVAHSSNRGGAELALRHLLTLLRSLDYEPTVLLPGMDGEFALWCQQEKFEGLVLPMMHTFPATSAAFLHVSIQGLESIAEKLKFRSFKAVITNTSVVLNGAYLAELLGIPHLTWIHEFIDDDSDIKIQSISSNTYLSMIGDTSDHVLCCSYSVESHVRRHGLRASSSVLYPYVNLAKNVPMISGSSGELQLLSIGVQSIRKNPIYALTVLQALRLRGVEANLHVIGPPASQTNQLMQAISQRGLESHVHIHGAVEDPYTIVNGCAINLVGANLEPFGLTIPESLSRGIPVVASRSGGPEELLDDLDLFEVNDLDACVRRIEEIYKNYGYYQIKAFERYKNIQNRFSFEEHKKILDGALDQAVRRYRDVPRKSAIFYGSRLRSAVKLDWLTRSILVDNISEASKLSIKDVEDKIQKELKKPGSAVLSDCKKYDVVPFANGNNSDILYSEGVGFSIELAATYSDESRLLMSAFIISMLIGRSYNKCIKILALGDGIGIDSMRLSSAGFDVDYMDYDASLTSKVARKNFLKYEEISNFNAGKIRVVTQETREDAYEVIVCLEVIEHVPNPMDFLCQLSRQTDVGGLIFISECFDGIRDIWPTHLYSNELYGGQLPEMARNYGLELIDCNVMPYGKPYVFKKIYDRK